MPLPTDPGPPEPPILTGNLLPYPSPTPTPYPSPSPYPSPAYPGDPSGAGYVNPSLFGPGYFGSNNNMQFGPGAGGNGPAGYQPSDIMQAYMDFYANDPRAGGVMAPGSGGNYPAPGTGGPAAQQQSVLGRIFGSTAPGALINILRGRWSDIPAVRLAQSIGHLFNPQQPWQQNAASNVNTGPGGGGPVGEAGHTADYIGYGQSPGSAADLKLMASQAQAQNPNYVGSRIQSPVSDAGHTVFSSGVQRISPEGGFDSLGPRGQPDPAGQALYQQALRAVPMDEGGFTWQYAQRLNDWVRANGPAQVSGGPADAAVNPIAISGPPVIPGGPASGGGPGPIEIPPWLRGAIG